MALYLKNSVSDSMNCLNHIFSNLSELVNSENLIAAAKSSQNGMKASFLWDIASRITLSCKNLF